MDCISNESVSESLRSSVQELGSSCCFLVQSATTLRENVDAKQPKRDLVAASRACSRLNNNILLSLQQAARGTQACLSSASAIESLLVDLETAALFATTGSVAPEGSGSFRDHQSSLLADAKGLIDKAKQLVSAGASSQEVLATAADASKEQFTSLVDTLRASLSALDGAGGQAQVLLLNAARDVGRALTDLLHATRNASGKSADVCP